MYIMFLNILLRVFKETPLLFEKPFLVSADYEKLTSTKKNALLKNILKNYCV